MKPDTSRWRDRHSYDFFDDLTVEGLAWECLRRDETYQLFYRNLVHSGMVEEPLSRAVEHRWGLRFCRQAGALIKNATGILVARRRSLDPDLCPLPRPLAVRSNCAARQYCGRAREPRWSPCDRRCYRRTAIAVARYRFERPARSAHSFR